MRVLKKDAPPSAVALIAKAGTFAAISTLLGSPLLGAFLLMEAASPGVAVHGRDRTPHGSIDPTQWCLPDRPGSTNI